MTRREALVGVLVAGFTSSCSSLFPTRYRYEVAVEVETPAGLSKGAGVMEASIAKQIAQVGDYGAYKPGFRGQAVQVPVQGKSVFALLDQELPNSLPRMFLGDQVDINDRVGTYARMASPQLRGRVLDLPRDRFPRFAFFADMSNPTTAQEVNPDDLATSLGIKGRIRHVRVTLTDRPVSRGIERSLPWLPGHNGALLRTNPALPMSEKPFAGQVHDGDLWRGMNNG